MGKYIKIEKKVSIGQLCRIHPSYGFAGIEQGMVKVGDFVQWKHLPKWFPKETYEEMDEGVRNEYWIQYAYTDKKHPEFGQINYLPASYFIDHITIC